MSAQACLHAHRGRYRGCGLEKGRSRGIWHATRWTDLDSGLLLPIFPFTSCSPRDDVAVVRKLDPWSLGVCACEGAGSIPFIPVPV